MSRSRSFDIQASTQSLPSNRPGYAAQRGRLASSMYDDDYNTSEYRQPSMSRPLQFKERGDPTLMRSARLALDKGSNWVNRNPILVIIIIFCLVALLYAFVQMVRRNRARR